MKNTVLSALTVLVLISCSHIKTDSDTPSGQLSVPSAEHEKKIKVLGKTGAIFHVIDPLGVKLVLLNVEAQREEIVLMDKTLSQLDLTPGFWQVSGFVSKGRYYKIVNSSKKFIFHLKKNEITYVGSYIFQCPKVNHTYLPQMKKMSFFNRYPFSSEKRLCELVVGSDFDNVNRVWVEMDVERHRPLSLGF